ncbi:hypothetical protein BDR22DRAFT_693550 [Usnea florida]
MARTWFAGHPNAPKVPPSKDPNGAASKKVDPAGSDERVSPQNMITVQDFAPTQQTIPTKARHSDSESDTSVAWVTPFSSPQKEPTSQKRAEAYDPPAIQAQLIRQQSKPKDPQTPATYKASSISKPVETMGIFAPSTFTQRRAPVAQMVPVTTAPAVATTTPNTLTKSLFGQFPTPVGTLDPAVSFPSTAPAPFSLPSIMPSTRAASSKKPIPKEPTPKKTILKKTTPRNPKIALTPAPSTAPTAFKDAALAARVQNTKLQTPAKRRLNGVKTSSPLQSVSTLEPVAEEGRGPVSSPTRSEVRSFSVEQSLEPPRQRRFPVPPRTPSPPTSDDYQTISSGSSFAPYSSPLQQGEQYVTFNSNGDVVPKFCSEEPRLWPAKATADHVLRLQHCNSMPETTHSEPIQACANHAAHTNKRHGHGVCSTCRTHAFRWIQATTPEVWLSAWWPLCKVCGNAEMQRTDPGMRGCSCARTWLCFSCQMLKLEMRGVKNSVEADFRRRIVPADGKNGEVETVTFDYACQCGKAVEPDATVLTCVGCGGVRFGTLDGRGILEHVEVLRKTALAWT